MWGASTLVINILIKKVPIEWINKLPVVINENKPEDDKDPLMKFYNDKAKGKAIKKEDD